MVNVRLQLCMLLLFLFLPLLALLIKKGMGDELLIRCLLSHITKLGYHQWDSIKIDGRPKFQTTWQAAQRTPPVLPAVASSFCLCFLNMLCFGPFFWLSEILRQTTLFFQFLLVRLYFSCFTCVAGLESNFYTHHLHLSKVSTFCTTIVWPICRSRGAAWIPHSLSFCEGKQIPHSLSLEVTWRSAERSIKRRVRSCLKKRRA